MGFTRKAVVATTTALTAFCIASGSAVASATTTHNEAVEGTAEIADEQMPNGSIPAFSPIGSTADAVMSLVAALRGPDEIRDALRYLARQTSQGNVIGVGLQAKVVMAVVAGGMNPRKFGGHNLVAEIHATEQPDGRYGASTAVFDHALALLALKAANATPSDEAILWLRDAQCADGGWQYDNPPQVGEDEHCFTGDFFSDYFQSDTNTTSYAVQALKATTDPLTLEDPFAFFTAIRDTQFGGWGYTWGFQTTDANSTGLVLEAYAAAGIPPPAGAMAALRALEYSKCDEFAFTWTDDGHGGYEKTPPNVGATIGGIMGLLKRPLPEEADDVTKNTPPLLNCGP